MRQTYVMVTVLLLFNTGCQDRLRVHLIRCLKSKHMIPFPSRCRRTGKPHVETISVYCSCRLPESNDEKLRWLHVTSAVNGITFLVPKFRQKYLRIPNCHGCVVNVRCERIPEEVFKNCVRARTVDFSSVRKFVNFACSVTKRTL